MTNGQGFRAPWWLTLGAGVLLVVMLIMHTKVEFIDRPLVHIGPFAITTFGIISVICVTIVLMTVRRFIDSLQATLAAGGWASVIIHGIMILGGVFFIVQIIIYAFGYEWQFVDFAARIVARGVSPAAAEGGG